VVGLLDVVAEFGKGHRVGIGQHSVRRSIHRGQHRNHRRRIQALGLAHFGQRFLAAATVINAEVFKMRERAGTARTISPTVVSMLIVFMVIV
jgi:hypothetical protein